MANITTRWEIIGNKEIADQYSEEVLTLKGKVERELYGVTSTDSWLNIPISKIGTISKIIANSTNAKLRITYTDGGDQTMTLPINGLFVYSVQALFSATITAIDVSTDSTQALDIIVSVLGV
jgi:hypothetical protein